MNELSDGREQDRFNVELKSRVDSLDRVREVAARLATEHLGRMLQVDTYFAGCRGRLKLREIKWLDANSDASNTNVPNTNDPAQLIWYERPDQADAKTSRYQLVDIADASGLKVALSEAYGIAKIVEKQREVFLHHNVRIHLDRVKGIGDFLEFEAVLNSRDEQQRGQQQVAELTAAFGLQTDWLLLGSYSDML
ncbi:MAG: class IV adenylate cyclase [Planctomycetales bacterium]|nr:class IV adenylate cyclase [Planctomycetales bacterium]